MIDVVLLSCDRREYTLRTMSSFLTHNHRSPEPFNLWHCDDASSDPKIRAAAKKSGFRELVYTDERVGVTEMVRRAARKLAHAGAEWMLLLENDWETVRPFPSAVFEAIQARGDVWALRLYGEYKERGEKLPAGTRHRGRGGADPLWDAFSAGGETYEIGDIHWGNPPSVARVELVAWLHKKARRERDAIVQSGLITQHVARVRENVVFHIGFDRTPGFVS